MTLKSDVIFGEIINRVEKIAGFDRTQGKVYGKRVTHSYPIFLRVSPSHLGRGIKSGKREIRTASTSTSD